MSLSWVRAIFAVTGVYDAVLGLAFFFFGARIFEVGEAPQPGHWGYLQFASLMLLIFAAMFFAVAYDPRANHNLIPYGMALKLAYTGLTAYYWVTADLPSIFKPFAVIDAAMFVLFLLAYRRRAAA